MPPLIFDTASFLRALRPRIEAIYRLLGSVTGRMRISTAIDRSRPQRAQRRIISVSVRDFGKAARQATRRTLTLVLLFFEAIVDARAMMARSQATGFAAGVPFKERNTIREWEASADCDCSPRISSPVRIAIRRPVITRPPTRTRALRKRCKARCSKQHLS